MALVSGVANPNHRIRLLVKPNANDSLLRKKLSNGMGHNYYGEIAWPNDLLYMFPVCILSTIVLALITATLFPTELGEAADPFATPLEILPEWFLLPTFQILRVIPNKILGILGMAAVPLGLAVVPFVESISSFQNPVRRPISIAVFVIGTVSAFVLGFASLQEL